MAEPFGNAGTVALVVALMPYELVDAFALDLFTLFQLGPTAGYLADLEPGLGLPDAVLCLGDCTIRGDLLVMHLTDRGASRICGALFYPATDGDLVKLKSAIAGMDAAR